MGDSRWTFHGENSSLSGTSLPRQSGSIYNWRRVAQAEIHSLRSLRMEGSVSKAGWPLGEGVSLEPLSTWPYGT